MNALGPLAKGLAFLMGKQPEEERHPRGFLGLEWVASDPAEPNRAGLRVRLVLAGSPAAKAGLMTDDQVLRINGRAVDSPKAVRTALADVQPGDTVRLLVRRGSGADARELQTRPHRRGGIVSHGPPIHPVRRTCRAERAAVALVLVAGLAWANLRLDPQETPATAKADKTRGRCRRQGQGQEVAVVPFAMLPTNHMLVEARINGKGPYRLIFDLGAPITLLNNRASEAAGVIKDDAPRTFLFGMRGEAEIDKLQAGELTATKLPVIVFDHPILKALEDMVGRKIDGIMGFTLFARFKTTIDYQARRMTFEPVDYEVRDLLKSLPDRMMGPKVAKHRVLTPLGLWGIRLGDADGRD